MNKKHLIKRMLSILMAVVVAAGIMTPSACAANRTYISEITLEAGADAVERLEADDWSVMSVGLNMSIEQEEQLYMGYKKSTDNAITNVIVTQDVGDTFTDENGISYTCASHVDVDEGIGGGTGCVYYTRDERAGAPLVGLDVLRGAVGDAEVLYPITNDGAEIVRTEKGNLSRDNDDMICKTEMYFGVSYTYNPYRAITGVAGLITPYTESIHQLKYIGLRTPAGTFRPCNVSLHGVPCTGAGIALGYLNVNSMQFPMYTNYNAKQKTDIPGMGRDENGELFETEILSHYLLTSGPRDGVEPLRRGDIVFVTHEHPGVMADYVPICDLRTPGDYERPNWCHFDVRGGTHEGSVGAGLL